MVLAGTGRDFTHSWIAGRPVMIDRAIPGTDLPAMQRQAQRQFEKLKEHQRRHAPGAPPADQVFRPSFRRAN
jgi:hypothetical protein